MDVSAVALSIRWNIQIFVISSLCTFCGNTKNACYCELGIWKNIAISIQEICSTKPIEILNPRLKFYV